MKGQYLRFGLLTLAAIVFIACAVEPTEETMDETNAAIYMKGVCYHPVEKGHTERSFDRIDEDLALMADAGMNTIRTYAPIEEVEVLDKIAEKGMKVVVGFGYNQDGYYDLLSGSYLDYVEQFKDHEAILMWELGNEYNYHPEWFEGDIMNWYTTLRDAVDAIHALDSVHPVATAHGELPDSVAFQMGAEVDMWGLNVYRWDQPATIIDEWNAVSDKPFYFSEVGADSYMRIADAGFAQGPNEDAQAVALDTIIGQILARQTENQGLLLFSFTDGWWKAGNPDVQDIGGWAPKSSGVPYDGAPNEEYWGVVDIDRQPKKAWSVIYEHFTK